MFIESLTPTVGGPIVVARGLGFTGGASEGCGGGVARCNSSRSTYMPDEFNQSRFTSTDTKAYSPSPTTSWYSGPDG